MKKTLKYLATIFITINLITFATAAETSIDSPESDSALDLSQNDLSLQWSSIQDHSSEDTLLESDIEIQGPGGSTLTQNVNREETLSQGEQTQDSLVFTESDFDKFQEGLWDISVTDTWNQELDGGVKITSKSGATVDVSMSKADPSFFEVSLTGTNSPITEGDSLSIDYEITNTGDESAEKDVAIDVGGLQSETRFYQLTGGETVSDSLSFETYDGGAGDYTAELSSEDDSDSASITVEEQSTDDGGGGETEDGEVRIDVTEPSSDYLYSEGDDLIVSWVSENNKSLSDEYLDSTELSVTDEAGNTVSQTVTQDTTVSSKSEESSSYTFSSSELDSLQLGDGQQVEWTLQVEDIWESTTRSGYVYFNAESNSTSDDSTDDTSDDGSDVIVDDGSDGNDSTNDSTDESTNDSDDSNSDNTTDDSTDNSSEDESSNNDSTDDSEDSDNEDSNNCPDGFTYDSENDVCLEDSNSDSDELDSDPGNNGGSDDNTDDSSNDDSSDDSSTDDQNSDDELTGGEASNTSMLQQEVAAGISVQTVLLGLLAVLTLGLLFKRSSYTLKF